MLSRSFLAVLWIASALGCRDPELAKLEAIRDEVCACKTIECGDDAMKRVPAVSGASNRRSQAVARAMVDCLAKLYAADRPETGPDVAGSAVPPPPIEP